MNQLARTWPERLICGTTPHDAAAARNRAYLEDHERQTGLAAFPSRVRQRRRFDRHRTRAFRVVLRPPTPPTDCRSGSFVTPKARSTLPKLPRPVPDGGMSYPLTRKGVAQARHARRCGRDADHGHLHQHASARGADGRRARLQHELTIDSRRRPSRSGSTSRKAERSAPATWTWRANGPSRKTSKRAPAPARASRRRSGAFCLSCARS